MFGKIIVAIVLVISVIIAYQFYDIQSTAGSVRHAIVNGDMESLKSHINYGQFDKNLQKRLLVDMKKTLDESINSNIPEVQEEQINAMANEIALLIAKFKEEKFLAKLFKTRGFDKDSNFTILLPDLGTILLQNDINKFGITFAREGLFGWKIVNMGVNGDKFLLMIRGDGL